MQIIKFDTREQWLDLRKYDLTASVIGALYPGVHPYTTVAKIAAEKRGLSVPGPDQESPLIRRGNALEKIVAEEVARAHPTWTIEKNDNQYFRDPDARIGATPDFFVIDPARKGIGILQTKVVASMTFREAWDEINPPFWVALQATTEMMMTGAEWGLIAALEIGDFIYKLHEYPVDRHYRAEARVKESVAEFWRAFDAGEEPKFDYERDGALLAIMYPQHVPDKSIDLTRDNELPELLERLEGIIAQRKANDKVIEIIQNEIKAKMGDAERAEANGWTLTLKTQHRKEHMVKASTFRVLRTKRKED